jgi:hypothetical protein
MRSALPLFLLSAASAAQAPTASAGPIRYYPVDAVVATVNDSAILRSTLVLLTAGRVRQYEANFGPMSPRDRALLANEALRAEIDRHRMAQAALSLGSMPPAQVEQILANEFDRERQARIRDLGSLSEFSRELQRTGRSWQSYEREQRVAKLHDVAQEFGIYQRLAKQQNLFLTPRMLRDTYVENRSLFVREAAAKVELVQFTGPDREAAAAQAAAAWRADAIDAAALAARHPGARSIGELAARSLAAEFAAITAFALAGPVDAVCDPVAVRDALFVAKVKEFSPGRNGRFEDPAVQEELRNLCLQRVIGEFRQQTLERARQRTEVWPPQEGR